MTEGLGGRRHLCAIGLATASLLAACTAGSAGSFSWTPPPSAPTLGSASGSPPAAGTTTFDEQGVSFEYPAAWHVYHYDVTSSFTSLIAEFATVEVANPCATTQIGNGGTQVSCQQSYSLEPDSLVVRFENRSFPGWNIQSARPAAARPLTVAGLPAYVVGTEPIPGTRADQAVEWTLSRPGIIDNYYAITANLRGPDLGPMRAQLDTLVASFRYETPVVPLPTGAAAADAAIARALTILPQGYDPPLAEAWSCFPHHVGTAQGMVAALPNGPVLVKPQLATCSVTIEPTDLQMWRATFTLRLSVVDPLAGLGEVKTIWIGADGTPTLVTGTAIPVPSASPSG